jgi:hypothetical protein
MSLHVLERLSAPANSCIAFAGDRFSISAKQRSKTSAERREARILRSTTFSQSYGMLTYRHWYFSWHYSRPMLHDFAVPDFRHRLVELAGLRKYFSLFFDHAKF